MAFLRRNQVRRSPIQSNRWRATGCEQLESREMKTAAMEFGHAATPTTNTASAAFVRFEGIDGEETGGRGHGQWSDLISMSQHRSQTRASSARF